MPRWGRLGIAGAAALALAAALAGSARADPAKCQAAIVKASASFVQAKARALHKCHDKVVRGKFPPTTQCPGDARTGFAIARAAEKMERAIVKACGGKDGDCGTADDESLAAIGWDIGTCPDFQLQGCGNSISSCADIPPCLECVSGLAVDQAMELYYDALAASDPKDQKPLNRCQAAIGKATTNYLATRSKRLAKCWSAVAKGKAVAPCPAAVAGTQQALDAAEARKITAICKACGGDDAFCGGGDDLTTAEIGFPASCPRVGDCEAPVSDLTGLVQCVDCVTDFDVDCGALGAVPGLAAYPPECVEPAAPQGILNFSLPPVYGSSALTSGFVPDPFTVGITAGGPVNVDYLGGGCTGFATSAPSFSVNYTSGAFPTLRFYFIGASDTTMIINTPGGSYVCVDDSFGTQNPTLDFNSPASGRYDVWIGSYSAGGAVAGTLYVTENTGNHP